MAIVEPGKVVKDNAGPLIMTGAVLVLLLAVAWYYGSGNTQPIGTNVVTNNSSNESEEPEEEAAEDSSGEPEMQLKVDTDYSATVKTNKGDIEIDLFEENAPLTVNNFVVLAEDGFYKDVIFHRVVEGFVIQGGDPTGTGTGGPGYAFKDEINPDSLGLDKVKVSEATFLAGLYNPYDASTAGYSPNSLREHADDSLSDFYDDAIGYDYDYSLESVKFGPGVVAMANSGPNTNGSQFFVAVTSSSTTSLNGRHTVFGEVIDGMDVVDEISGVLVDQSDKPVDDVVIERVTIHEI